MMMKRVLSLLLVFVTVIGFSACGKEKLLNHSFKYQSKSYDYTSDMYYDDSIFPASACDYDASLATASLSFAMASFASMTEKRYEYKSTNAKELLTAFGYGDIRTNAYYQEKPSSDSLGCIFGHKEISGRQMIACGVRGANYGSEWASNITVGTDRTYHQGFFEGSQILLNSLKEYLSEVGVKGKISLWIVGYSRAGAVCNLAAGQLDEAIQERQSILGEGISLSKDNMYAYCFEPPQGVCYDDQLYPKSDIFSNIFCIVNHNDIVTKTAMKEFGFTRYGVDKVLFSPLNDIHYNDDIEAVKDIFQSYENSGILGDYAVDDFEMKGFADNILLNKNNYCHWTQGIYLDDFLSRITLYGLESREYYAETIQPGLREIMSYLFSQDNVNASLLDLGMSAVKNIIITNSGDLLIDDLLHNPRKLNTDLKIVINKALSFLEVDLSADDVEQAIEKLLGAIMKATLFKGETSLIVPFLSKANIMGIGQAHQPELTLAFLRALDPVYSDDPVDYSLDGKYYYIEVDDDDADVSVICEDEEIVRFEKGSPIDVGSAVPYAKQQTLRIYLPYHCAYTVACSTDQVSVKVYDPACVDYRDVSVNAQASADGYQLVIPAAD